MKSKSKIILIVLILSILIINNSSFAQTKQAIPTGYKVKPFPQYKIVQITDNVEDEINPDVNIHGHVVWQYFDNNDWEILYYDGTGITQLTHDDWDDQYPQISDNGHIVWHKGELNYDDEIWLYDGNTINKITNTTHRKGAPKINKHGHFVWRENNLAKPQIMLYDGAIHQISTSIDHLNNYPQISDSGNITWQGNLYGGENEIFLYDGTVNQLTNDTAPDVNPQVSNDGYVTWRKGDADRHIMQYDGVSVTQISDPLSSHNVWPQINNNNHIAWTGRASGSTKTSVFLFDGSTKTQIVVDPQESAIGPVSLNNKNHIAFANNTYDNDWEMFLYKNGKILQITDNYDMDDEAPILSDSGYITWIVDEYPDGEIFLAVPQPMFYK